MTPIRIIRDEGRIPSRTECWECFQPPLFPLLGALVLKPLPIRNHGIETRVVQLISCAAGILTLVVLAGWLDRLPLRPRTRWLALALASTSPPLVAISVQATNDSLVTLLATLCLVHAHAFIRTWRGRDALVMSAAAILAALTKGNGIVLLPVVATALAWRAVARSTAGLDRATARRAALATAGFVAAWFAIVPFAGPYFTAWRETGTPFATNIPRKPAPRLLTPTPTRHPGVTSIAESYLTFRLLDLVANPAINYDSTTVPRHKTSLWSQLYARAVSLRFEQWPPTWAGTGTGVRALTRAALVLGLVPLGALILGGVRLTATAARAIRRRDASTTGFGADLTLLTAVGFLAFIVAYTWSYRDISTMKAIFLAPGALAWLTLVAQGLDGPPQRVGSSRVRVVELAVLAAAVVSALDAAVLAGHLTTSLLEAHPLATLLGRGGPGA